MFSIHFGGSLSSLCENILTTNDHSWIFSFKTNLETSNIFRAKDSKTFFKKFVIWQVADILTGRYPQTIRHLPSNGRESRLQVEKVPWRRGEYIFKSKLYNSFSEVDCSGCGNTNLSGWWKPPRNLPNPLEKRNFPRFLIPSISPPPSPLLPNSLSRVWSMLLV